jgi:single-stranded DNA-specific DHH superfamily exonuclease
MAYLQKVQRQVREKEFLNKLKEVAAFFSDIKKQLEHILIIAHNDADGYASSILIQKMANRENISCSAKYYNRNGTWADYLNEILPNFDKYEDFAIFFADLGSEVREIANVFKEDSAEVFILDHHEMEKIDEKILPDNVHLLNPTLYGYDGLKEIAGSTLAYMFTKEISNNNIENAWITLIGITNDSLMNVSEYHSFNKDVLEEAKSEQQIIIRDGLMTYGATHEKLKPALAHSIFPFIREIAGDLRVSGEIIEKLNIDGNKKVTELTPDEIDKICNRFPMERLRGQYIEFPKKKTLLRYAFEHGLLISVSAYKYPVQAEKLIASVSGPAELKSEYTQYVKLLTKYLGLFVKTPKEYTEHVIFVDAGKRIPSNYWSDVASYSSVNNLYNPDKFLILGGPDGSIVKLSIRCSDLLPSLKENKGVDSLISKMRRIYLGTGGGHKLAGGYRIAPNKFRKLKSEIEQLFPL